MLVVFSSFADFFRIHTVWFFATLTSFHLYKNFMSSFLFLTIIFVYYQANFFVSKKLMTVFIVCADVAKWSTPLNIILHKLLNAFIFHFYEGL